MKRMFVGGVALVVLAGAMLLAGAIPAQADYWYGNRVDSYQTCRNMIMVTTVILEGQGSTVYGWGCSKGADGKYTPSIHYSR